MNLESLVGWAASLLLFITVGSQVVKQYRERSCEGVSRFLFVGQLLASVLFLAYAVMGDNLVFIVSNAFMVATALLGQVILMRNRRLADAGSAAGEPADPGSARG